MNHIAIRPTRVQDFARVLAINHVGHPGVALLTAAELAVVLRQSPYFCVAEREAEVVGYLIAYTSESSYDGEEFEWFQRHDVNFLYIDQIAVASTQRRGSIGSSLYQQAEHFALQHQLSCLVCEVNIDPPNPVSRAFHVHQQFIEVGKLATQDGRTVALLRKSLTFPFAA